MSDIVDPCDVTAGLHQTMPKGPHLAALAYLVPASLVNTSFEKQERSPVHAPSRGRDQVLVSDSHIGSRQPP
jgi:hypothetical protein